MSDDERKPAARPSKRLKMTASAASKGSDLPLILRLTLPFVDKYCLLLKMSEVSKGCRDIALNEIVRRFHTQHVAKAAGEKKFTEDIGYAARGIAVYAAEQGGGTMLGCACNGSCLRMQPNLIATNEVPESLATPFVKEWVETEVERANKKHAVPSFSDESLTSEVQFQDESGHSHTKQLFDTHKVQERLEQQGSVTLTNERGRGRRLRALFSNIVLTPDELKQAVQDPLPVLFRDEEIFQRLNRQMGTVTIFFSEDTGELKIMMLTTKRMVQHTMKHLCAWKQSTKNDDDTCTFKRIKISTSHLPNDNDNDDDDNDNDNDDDDDDDDDDGDRRRLVSGASLFSWLF